MRLPKCAAACTGMRGHHRHLSPNTWCAPPALEQHQRLNRALRVSRVDPLVVALLGRLATTQLSPHFRVVGTHALYAYEAAAGVRLDTGTQATRDMDLLWDTRTNASSSQPSWPR